MWKSMIGLSLGALLLNIVFTPVATGRPVLNQTPESLERYFGHPVREVTGKPPLRFNIYSSERLKKLIPQTTDFDIYFYEQRASHIVIKFFRPIPYSQTEASALFSYIFGYNPQMWKQIRRDNLPKSYGQTVTDFAYCIGNGIANEFTTYGSSVHYVSFKINSSCQIPEHPGKLTSSN